MSPVRLTRDERRTACLLFVDELSDGLLDPAQLAHPAVEEAVRAHPVPAGPTRRLQSRSIASGRLDLGALLAPMAAARAAVLGARAAGAPRVLLSLGVHRPGNQAEREGLLAAHSVLRDAGVPYLLAIDLSGGLPEEQPGALLAVLREEGVELGLAVDAPARPRRPGPEAMIDAALFAHRGIAPQARVAASDGAPLAARAWKPLARRVDVVLTVPADVATLGLHRGPLWRGEAVHLPSYAPAHGSARGALGALRALTGERLRLWVPVSLDWRREGEQGLVDLREVATALAAGGLARPWGEFVAAVGASRALGDA